MSEPRGGSETMPTTEELRALRDRHESWLRVQPGVVATSISLGPDGNPCLRLFVQHLSAATHTKIKKRLRNVPLQFEERGEFLPYSR